MKIPADLTGPLAEVAQHFAACGFSPICAEQIECLLDATREDEALEMIDDWEARCGLPSDIRADLSAWIVDRHYINARA